MFYTLTVDSLTLVCTVRCVLVEDIDIRLLRFEKLEICGLLEIICPYSAKRFVRLPPVAKVLMVLESTTNPNFQVLTLKRSIHSISTIASGFSTWRITQLITLENE